MNSHQHHYTPLCHAGFWVLWLILLVSLLLAAFLVGSSSLSVWQANATPTGAWAMLIPAGGIVMLEVVGAAVLQWFYWRRAASPLVLCLSTAGAVAVAVLALPMVGVMSGF